MALIVFTRFVERIGIAGVTILISAGLKEDDGREISAIQHRGEIYKIVLMICAIRGGSNQSRVARPNVMMVGSLRAELAGVARRRKVGRTYHGTGTAGGSLQADAALHRYQRREGATGGGAHPE